jgi:hypothetical protein
VPLAWKHPFAGISQSVPDGKPKHHPLDTTKIEVVWNRTSAIVKQTSVMDPDLAAFYQTFEDGSVVLVHDFVSF